MKKFLLAPFLDAAWVRPIDLQVVIDRSSHSQFQIQFVLVGDVDRIKFSSVNPWPQRITGLWETTCFEFFFGVPQQKQYWEVNLSPSGDWNVFRLDRYRENLQEERAIETLRFEVKQEADRVTVALTVDLQPLGLVDQPIELSATSVIQMKTGAISYWAVNHAGPEADFHLRDSFVIRL